MSDIQPLQPGEKAPTISVELDNGVLGLSAPGRLTLIYFYPKDDTPGCTTQACALRDAWTRLENLGLLVIGVSPDDDKSHAKFRAKYSLPFPLVADTDQSVSRAFGVWGPKQFMGKHYEGIHRTSFLISANGEILKTYPKVKPDAHAELLIHDVNSLQQNS